MKKLTHEGYRVLDWIRAWDFEPMPGRRNRYVEGIILEVCRDGNENHPFAHYRIEVVHDAAFTDDPREIVIVPMQVVILEWDTRVELVRRPVEKVG